MQDKSVIGLLVAALSLGGMMVLMLQRAVETRVTSAESHAVWNYIVEAGVRPQMETRFNTVNGDWPPTKAEMAQVLLEARVAAERKSATVPK